MRRVGGASDGVRSWPRVRFGEMGVLKGRGEGGQVAGGDRQLRSDGLEVRRYALGAAVDSLRAVRRPREAIEAMEGATAALPDDVDTQVVLAYAYLEVG